MYMNNTVGIAELRQNLSRYLRRVENGERLLVTDRNKVVAELGPAPSTGEALDRLIAEGRVARPTRRGLPPPLRITGRGIRGLLSDTLVPTPPCNLRCGPPTRVI